MAIIEYDLSHLREQDISGTIKKRLMLMKLFLKTVITLVLFPNKLHYANEPHIL